MGKVRYKYSPDRIFQLWYEAMTQPVVEVPPSELSAEDKQVDAIIEKLKEDFPDYPHVARDMNIDGRPFEISSKRLRVNGLRIEDDKVVFTFKVQRDKERLPSTDIANFLGCIGFTHFSKEFTKGKLKPGRYALFEPKYPDIDESFRNRGMCEIGVMKDCLLKYLGMYFTTKEDLRSNSPQSAIPSK